MFFEYDPAFASVSPHWRQVREHLVDERLDQIEEAFRAAWPTGIRSQEEALLAIGAASDCAASRMRFDDGLPCPQSPPLDPASLGEFARAPRVIATLRLAWTHVDGLLRTEARLREELPSTEGLLRSLLTAVHIQLLSYQGRRDAAREQVATLTLDGVHAVDQAWIAWRVGDALVRVRCWEEAIPWLKRARDGAPSWVRPLLSLADSLSALGETTRATDLRQKLIQAAPHHPSTRNVRLSQAWDARAWHEVVELAEEFEKHEARAPSVQTDTYQVLKLFALWKLRRFDEVRALTPALSPKWQSQLAQWNPEGVVTHVPVRGIVQDRDMCVAASVAMLLETMGRSIESRVLYNEMNGGHGVTLHQLHTWLTNQGLTLTALGTDLRMLRESLRLGHPLLCISGHVTSSHMELLIGMHDDLACVEILDPGGGTPHLTPYSAFEEAYGNSGMGVYMVTGASSAPEAQKLAAYANQQLPDHLARTSLLTWNAAYDEAEHLLARIPEGGARDLLLTRHLEVLCDSADAVPLFRRIADNTKLSAQERVQALLSLHNEEIDIDSPQVATLLNELDPFAAECIRISLDHRHGRWKEVLRRSENLLRFSSTGTTWLSYAIVLDQHGYRDRASHALNIAADVAHEDADVLLRQHQLHPPASTEERRDLLSRLQTLLHRAPHRLMVRQAAIQAAMQQGEFNLAAELTVDAIRLHPRSPHAAQLVYSLYDASQQRPDLTIETLRAHGRGAVLELPMAKDIHPLGAYTEDELQKVMAFNAASVDSGDGSDSQTEATHRIDPRAMTFESLLIQVSCANEKDSKIPHAKELKRRAGQDASLTDIQRFEAYSELCARAVRIDPEMTVEEFKAHLPRFLPSPTERSGGIFTDCLLASQPRTSLAWAALRWLDQQQHDEDKRGKATVYRARLLSAAGQLKEAGTTLRTCLANRPDPFAARALGLLLAQAGEYREATDALKASLHATPGDTLVLAHLADISSALQDPKEEERASLERIRVAPLHPIAAMDYLLVLVNRDALDHAKRWLSENGHRYPAWLPDWLEAANLRRLGKYEEAVTKLNEEAIMANHAGIGTFVFDIIADPVIGHQNPRLDLIQRATEDVRTRNLPSVIRARWSICASVDEERTVYFEALVHSPTSDYAHATLSRTTPDHRRNVCSAALQRVSDHRKRKVLTICLFEALLELEGQDLVTELLTHALKAGNPLPELLFLCIEHGQHIKDQRMVEYGLNTLIPLAWAEPEYGASTAALLIRLRPAEAVKFVQRELAQSVNPRQLAVWILRFSEAHQLEAFLPVLEEEAAQNPGQPAILHVRLKLGLNKHAILESLEGALNAPVDNLHHGLAVALLRWAMVENVTLPQRWEDWAVTEIMTCQDRTGNGEPGKDELLLTCALYVWCITHRRTHILHLIHHSPSLDLLVANKRDVQALTSSLHWCVDDARTEGPSRAQLQSQWRSRMRWAKLRAWKPIQQV